MTDKNQQPQKQGEKPTHSLFVKSEMYGSPLNMRFAAVWDHPEKGYMSLSPEKFRIRINPNAKNGELPVELFLKTKIYGQEAYVPFGKVTAEETKNCFEVNEFDLVIFENKPREVEQSKKVATIIP